MAPPKYRIFVGSSTEGKEYAKVIQELLIDEKLMLLGGGKTRFFHRAVPSSNHWNMPYRISAEPF
jgi:hypothetical protein